MLKKRAIIPLMAGAITTGILTMGATSFAAGPPPSSSVNNTSTTSAHLAISPKHHRQHHHKQHLGRITAVTSTNVTIRRGKHTKSINLAGMTLHAGPYPVTSAFLQTGQPILKHGHQITVVPIMQGTLTAAGSGWTVVNKSHTIALPTTVDQLGLQALAGNIRVMVFGQRSGTTVTVDAIAATPKRVRGVVMSNQTGILTVKTPANATLTITETSLPHAKWLAKIPVGRRVVVVFDPSTQAVLGVLPVPHPMREHGMSRMTVGKVVSESPQNLVVSNVLGNDAISLSGKTVKVDWPHHSGATISQIPVGTPVMVHAAGSQVLQIHVF